MKKRCGCYVDKDGHPVQLCPMHEGLLASRLKKAKHKVFAGIRRSNPKRKKRRVKAKRNPLGFALRATKGQGAVLWYTGQHFSSDQTPKYYSTVKAAQIDGRKIAATYGNGPMRGYKLTIWTYPTRPK